MIEQTVTVSSSFGTRSAALLVQTASKFGCNIYIKIAGKNANAKSIMGIIALGAAIGEEVQLVADGPDEQQAIAALQQFFE